LKKNENLLCKAVLTQQKKILHRDDIDVSKKHKKTKKIVCPSHDKHLKKNQKQKKSKMSTSWFFSSLKKKTHKNSVFSAWNEKWRRKEIEKF